MISLLRLVAGRLAAGIFEKRNWTKLSHEAMHQVRPFTDSMLGRGCRV